MPSGTPIRHLRSSTQPLLFAVPFFGLCLLFLWASKVRLHSVLLKRRAARLVGSYSGWQPSKVSLAVPRLQSNQSHRKQSNYLSVNIGWNFSQPSLCQHSSSRRQAEYSWEQVSGGAICSWKRFPDISETSWLCVSEPGSEMDIASSHGLLSCGHLFAHPPNDKNGNVAN